MRTTIIIAVMAIFFFSCKKDEPTELIPTTDPTSTSNSYLPLKIGNYWVYKNYNRDSLGVETELSQIDSIYISKDTIINGNTFYIIEGENYPFNNSSRSILRDSGDYIVNNDGTILFSSSNFTSILNYFVFTNANDTIYTSTAKMYNSPQISTPAGLFSALNYKCEIVTTHPNNYIHNPRYTEDAYAQGVGKVYKVIFFINSPNFIVKRLLRYHVQN